MVRFKPMFAVMGLWFACASAAWAYTAQDYCPNQQNNVWSYEIGGRFMAGTQFDVTIAARSGGWALFQAADQFYGTGWGDRYWWVSSESGRLYVWNASTGRYSLVFDLDVGEGESFTADIDNDPCLDGTVWTVTDRHASVTTRVGSFDDALVLNLSRGVCADAGLTRLVFAPGVGLVEYAWSNIAGEHTARLTHASVGATEYVQAVEPAAGIGVALAIGRFGYTVSPDQMQREPDTVIARLGINNGSSEVMRYNYNSGQDFDFVIRNDQGQEVYRWSHGRVFIAVVRETSLAPGESLSFEETIELRNSSGEALGPGAYTIEGMHSGGSEQATLGFSIELETELEIVE